MLPLFSRGFVHFCSPLVSARGPKRGPPPGLLKAYTKDYAGGNDGDEQWHANGRQPCDENNDRPRTTASRIGSPDPPRAPAAAASLGVFQKPHARLRNVRRRARRIGAPLPAGAGMGTAAAHHGRL